MNYERPQFFRVMAYARSADRDAVDMVSGNPDWEPPDALRAGLREYADRPVSEFQYPPSEGLLALREEIAERRGVPLERVVVTNGAGEANHLAMACGLAACPGREVVLADPVYPYYAGRAELLDARARYVPVGPGGALDPDDVAEAVSEETAVVLVNTPNNPTGAVYPRETLRALCDLAEDHDALLVSDEVYDHFDYAGEFESALSVDSPRRVVTNAFSKSMAITGLRVGYGVFPGWLVDAVRTRHMLSTVTGSRPAQYAVHRALCETGPDYYAANRRRLRERVAAFADALADAGAEVTRPDGGFYVLARFDGLPGTMATAERLVDEAGVACMPGETFGEARADWLRFALVTPRAREAAERLVDYLG